MKNYLIYPTKVMNITQGYTGSFSHSKNSSGTPKDFPIDEAGKDIGRDYIYCPCDEMKVTRIYGVGNSGTNTIWLTSTSKVDMPCGSDYITMMIIHPEDDDLSKLKVGQIFKRGEPMFREGKDGFATGNHFHIVFGKGNIVGNGWVQNNKSEWVLNTTNGTIKPEDACYLDSNFTKVINTQGIQFQTLPETDNNASQSTLKGIDVSIHNGDIDWNKVKNSGIDFVMIRAGFGNAETQIDKKFKSNMDGAIAAGLNVGCYWFSYAININEVKEEAALFNKVLTPYKGKITFPLVYDFEYDSVDYAKKNGVNITKSIATQFVEVFCKEMENYGWYAMNYTNYDYYINYFDKELLKNIDIWYANWSINSPNIICGIWQYKANGVVDGIIGDVDMNVAYKDYPTIIKNAQLNGFSNKLNIDYKQKYEEEVQYAEKLIKQVEVLENQIDRIKSDIQNILDNN